MGRNGELGDRRYAKSGNSMLAALPPELKPVIVLSARKFEICIRIRKW